MVRTSNYGCILPPLLPNLCFEPDDCRIAMEIHPFYLLEAGIQVYIEASDETPACLPCHSPARMGRGSALISLAY